MSNDEQRRPLAAIVGERLKAFREDKGLRQADLAAAASKWGLPWARSSIAALEAGTRNLSVEELLLLPCVISDLGGWTNPLIPPDAWLPLSSTREIQAKHLHDLAYGLTVPQFDANAKHPLDGTTLGIRRPEQVQADMDDELYSRQMHAEDMAWRLFCARAYPGIWDRGMGHGANLGKDLEFVARVAKKIENPQGGTASYGLINVLSWVLWRAPLEVERDRRTRLRGVLSGRGLQSAKGHVTRELTNELQEAANKVWPVLNDIFGELAPIWGDASKLQSWADKARREALHLDGEARRISRLEEFAQMYPYENAVLDEIAGEIRAGREAADLTHEQLADMVLISPTTIQSIERGEYLKGRDPGRVRKYVGALSHAVGIDAASLLRRYEQACLADGRDG